jgi:molybdopterin-containing oxidoreductase family membrane subunit
MRKIDKSKQYYRTKRGKALLSHSVHTSMKYKLWVAFLLLVILVGGYAYYKQLKLGLVVTAMRDYTSWGIYISNFVFFVAISLVGSLISSILKLNKNDWARPLTRISEIIAVSAIICAAVIIIVDMGRPDRFFFVLTHLRIQSPIIWDVIIISTYLMISFILLYLSLLPDIALCRDRLTVIPKWKKKMYRILAINWTNHPDQRRILSKISHLLAITVLPVAFAIHTVTSWLFATTWRPGWDSTNLGPYFVSGAFMAGAAVIIIAMYLMRIHLKLKKYITTLHFEKMGKLLVLLSLVYLYFNINEYLFKPFRKPLPIFIISIFIIFGAWFKRFLIVIPSLQHPYLPIQGVDESYLHYYPTWEEWAITFSSFAWFLLIITVLVKLFPVIPILKPKEEIKINLKSKSK